MSEAHTTIQSWRIDSYALPAPRVIGDSHDRIEVLPFGSLELESSSGQVGLGFFSSPSYPEPAPPLEVLRRSFERDIAPGLIGRTAIELTGQVHRARSFAVGRSVFEDAVNQAVWDLLGKELGLPLYRLLGGTQPRVRAYASALDFHLSTDDAQAFFSDAAAQGFTAFKVKVGRPRVRDDIARLRAVSEAVGPDATILVDANEAWTPKETIRRTAAYLDAGIKLYWVEDPCLRHDLDGLAMLTQELPVHLCLGDYLDPSGKVAAIERRACDIVRVGEHITDSMRVGWLAAEHGMPVVIHNTAFDLGVHLGAALPEVVFMEYSFLGFERVTTCAIQCSDGYAIAPDRPGHGVVLDRDACAEYSATAT